VWRALEPLQIPLEFKKQHFEVHGNDEASFTGDLNWSAEALTNVVKNCIEHTPEDGRIEIRYGANALYAEIIVSDDGRGIASRDIPHIFSGRSCQGSRSVWGLCVVLVSCILAVG
jgi:signal transduction histidine kinase